MRRFFLGVLALLLLATVSLAALHTYYHFTPVELSAEARSLDERAAALPRDTDNGLRLVGLLAPVEADPVSFGRCVLEAERDFWSDVEKHSSQSADTKALLESMQEATSAKKKQCAGTGNQLQAPDSKALPQLRLHSSAEDWSSWADLKAPPVLWTRHEQVMGTAPRYLTPNLYLSGLENYGTLTTLHRIQMAQAVEQWRKGQTEAALGAWETSVRQWSRIAPESLISSMLAVAAISQTLASMHAAWEAPSSPMDPAAWNRVQAITHIADSLPGALEASVVTDWALTSYVLRHSIPSSGEAGGKLLLQNWLYDLNHTVNLFAKNASARTSLLRLTAEGKAVAWEVDEGSCSAPNAWPAHPLCQIVGRNPMGQVLSSVGTKFYESYGTRVADLLNFAAATRLVAESKKQSISSAALPAWLERASADQRDIYTSRPFSFDPVGPALRVPLKQRNPVLGDAGEYRLPL